MKYQMAWPYFPDNEIELILEQYREILKGNAPLSMGPRVKEFEELFANEVNAPYAIATNTCSAALEIALRCIDLNENDDVLVPVETFFATGAAVIREGANIIFCDIDPQTYCLSLKEIQQRITVNTKAIIIVHMAGMLSPDLLKIRDFCKQKNIILIEDAAHAHGSAIENIRAGTVGDIGCFSFYPTKIMTTAEGGMLVCSNPKIADKADSYRNRGRDMKAETESYSRLGTNNRMTEFSAILGLSQLRQLSKFIKNRNDVAEIYNKKINESKARVLATPIPVSKNIKHSYWRYIVTLKKGIDREVVINELKKKEIPSDTAYYPLLHMQPYFIKKMNSREGQFPVAEEMIKRSLCLPINSLMTVEDAEYVVDSFIEIMLKCQ